MTAAPFRVTKRSLAFVVAVAAILAIAVPFAPTALASHPTNCTLEVLEEVDSNPSGSTHTLTAQLFFGSGSTPCTVNSSLALQVNIDFEVESGPTVRTDCTVGPDDSCSGGTVNSDGNSPSSPDMTCDIGSPGGTGAGASSCTVRFTSSSGGTNIIRAFVDEARNNAGASNPTYDASEGRYAGLTDCETSPGARDRTSTGTGVGAGERCNFDATQGGNLPPEPGGTGEPDTTDVVKKTWTQGLTGSTCLDVDPNTDTNPSGTEHTISARVTTAARRTASNTSDTSGDSCATTTNPGLPREGVQVNFSLNDSDTGISGSDDPNAFFSRINGASTSPSGGGPNNVTCITNQDGTCNVTIKTVSATAAGDNYVIGEVPGATGGSGGACSDPSFPGGTGGTGTGAENSCTKEVVRKTWVALGTVTRVDASPEEDTNEVNTSHTITATTTNALDQPISGQTITFDVTSGVNSTRDLDGNPSTPGGFIGECTTAADGSCSASYSSNVVGIDTITACIDANASFECEAAEADSGNTTLGDANDDQVSKTWVATGQGASQIALDMEGCNGSLIDPDSTTYEATATVNDVSNDRNDAHAVCARVFNSADAEVRVPVTFTITSGPGQFVVPSSTNASTFEEDSEHDLGTTVTADPGTCSTGAPGPGTAPPATGSTGRGSGSYNCAFLLSDTTGSTVVRACVHESTTICDTGTKPWRTTVQNARHVAVTPETATNAPGTSHTFTATVTDRFGNPVAGVSVAWARTGEGVVTTQETTTNAEGQARAVVTSDTEGTTTVSATIPAAQTDCDEPANAPANRESATAGNCTDSGTKTWREGPVTECNDDIDNDGDGEIDFPDDPGCTSAEDDSEEDLPDECTGEGIVAGTDGPDILNGTAGDDVLCGLGGNDTLNGLGGNDVLLGGGGDDELNGGDGADTIEGDEVAACLDTGCAPGNDTANGGGGKDTIRGHAGNDTLLGGNKNDLMVGNAGNDVLRGQNGWDTIRGNAGDDRMIGNAGNDILQGGGGNDTAKGGAGNDTIRGFTGRDTLRGGGGEDILKGAAGRDTLRGGAGDDVLNGGAGRDRCFGGRGNDSLRRCE